MDPRSKDIPNTVVISGRFPDQQSLENDQRELPEPHIQPGTHLGNYLIISRIAGGGMGEVYRAEDTELHRTVALKVLPPEHYNTEHAKERLQTEARAQARLQHPNIVTLYAMEEFTAGKVLVMEYVEGQTLEQWLKTHGPLPPVDAAYLFEQALQAVEHAHACGIIHRDLKPSNLFITRDDQAKLIDFGVAKIQTQGDQSASQTMVGTLLYMAPEQINGGEADIRSDIYTLGISLFEAVTGRLPFERRSDYALMHAHVQENPPTPRKYSRRVPKALEKIIMRAIEKDPVYRFQNAGEFLEALLRIGLLERRHGRMSDKAERKGLTTPRRYEPRPVSLSNRLFGNLAFDALLILLVGGIIYWLGLYPPSSNKNLTADKPKVTQTAKQKISAPPKRTRLLAANKKIRGKRIRTGKRPTRAVEYRQDWRRYLRLKSLRRPIKKFLKAL